MVFTGGTGFFSTVCLSALMGFLTVSQTLAVDQTVVASGASCRYRVPSDGTLGTNWTACTFADTGWTAGRSGLGYDTAPTYTALFATTVPVGSLAIYTRFPFVVDRPEQLMALTLRVKYDDGFIAYLNGVEIARANAPAGATWNTAADSWHDDGLAQIFQDYNVSTALPYVLAGTNVLAVHALNQSSGSTDFLIVPELVVGLPDVVTNLVVNEFMALND